MKRSKSSQPDCWTQVPGVRRPGAHHAARTVEGQSPIDQRQRAPGPIVTGTEHGQGQLGSGHHPRVNHRAGRRGVVAPEDGVRGAVRVHGPQRLGVAEIAIHVFPSVIENPAIGHQGGVAFEERALADLVDVGAVGLHAKEVGHDVPVAHAILRLAGRGKHDAAVRQIQRIEIVHVRSERQLLQAAAVSADFIEVVAVGRVPAHREHNLAPRRNALPGRESRLRPLPAGS